VKSLKVQERKTGIMHEISSQHQFSTEETSSSGDEKHVRFSSLPNDKKEKIDQILFLLDRFCVGDKFLHELTMICRWLAKVILG
jgi:hypothetical protein